MKKVLFTFLILAVAVSAFAETRPFEVAKTSYDPYIAESRGFDSLFVNPAGMAGQTEAFVWEIEAGTQGKRSTYETLVMFMENSDMLSGQSGNTMTEEEAGVMVELIVDNLDQTDVDIITSGTVFDGMTPAEIEEWFENNTLTEAQAQAIGTNIEDNPTVIDNAMNSLMGELKVMVEATTKIGTLIKGFGIAYYLNVYSILDAAEMGFDQLIAETGIKAGYGFEIGPISLGVSGDFAMVGDLTAYGGIALTELGDIVNATMTYGYAWGIDVGVKFQPFEWFSVGAVMTDIIGSYSPAGDITIQDFINGGASTDIPFTYSFDLDLDIGVTFTPQLGKFFVTSFSVDYYDFIEVFRTPPQNFQDVLDHMRFGASIELLKFINCRFQYYQEYFTLGAGLDLLFFEVFGEFMFNQEFDDLGGAILIKFHF